MKIENLPEEPTINDFKELEKQELDLIPYDVLFAKCCVVGCENGTTVRDYGFAPFFFLNRNSKSAMKHPEKYWLNFAEIVWFCGKHNEYYKRFGDAIFVRKTIEQTIPFEIKKRVNQSIEFAE